MHLGSLTAQEGDVRSFLHEDVTMDMGKTLKTACLGVRLPE